jgi:hypothetical protein
MANISFSLNRGQTAFSVTEGTDAPATGDFEVCIKFVELRYEQRHPPKQRDSDFARSRRGMDCRPFQHRRVR